LKFEEEKKRIRDTVPCGEANTSYGGILSKSHMIPYAQASKFLKLTPQDMEAKLHHPLANFGEFD
jgi:hypothetical protein